MQMIVPENRYRAKSLKTMPFGKHKGKAFSDVPVSYINWLLRPEMDLKNPLKATLTAFMDDVAAPKTKSVPVPKKTVLDDRKVVEETEKSDAYKLKMAEAFVVARRRGHGSAANIGNFKYVPSSKKFIGIDSKITCIGGGDVVRGNKSITVVNESTGNGVTFFYKNTDKGANGSTMVWNYISECGLNLSIVHDPNVAVDGDPQ